MRWKLQDYLDRHDLNAHRLVQATGLSSNTIYPMTRGEAQRVSLATLETVLLALRDLTGETVGVGDLLELEDNRATGASWEALAGLFDLPDTLTDGAINHDHYIDEALAEEHEESLQGQR